MKEMTLKDVQDVSLDIMKNLHKFCIAHNLRYSMGFGTLLGAVRHKGFIPWDDDIDIVMLRNDYDKFCAVWKDTPEFKLFNYERGNMYAACSRLCDMQQTFVKTGTPLFTEQTGIWIDIFPLDYIDDDHDAFLKHNYIVKDAHLNVMKKRDSMVNWDDRVKNVATATKWIAKKIIRHQSVMKLVSYHVQLCKNFSAPSHRVCCLSFPTYLDRESTPIHVFDNYIELPFEGTHFLAMKGYDEYLHGIYDNYMQMPPKEKQTRGHSCHKFYWKFK